MTTKQIDKVNGAILYALYLHSLTSTSSQVHTDSYKISAAADAAANAMITRW